MYAIVDIAGQQLKVEKNQKVFVNRLQGKEGSKVDFDQVLLVDDEGKVKIGTPVVKDMIVTATIISHLKGDKVIVFKKKRRKGYQKLNGHRQFLTEVLIESISEGKAKSQTAAKTDTKPTETRNEVSKTSEETKETKPKATTAAPSKAKSTAVKKEVKADSKPKATTAKKPKATTAKKPQAAKAKKPAAKK